MNNFSRFLFCHHVITCFVNGVFILKLNLFVTKMTQMLNTEGLFFNN